MCQTESIYNAYFWVAFCFSVSSFVITLFVTSSFYFGMYIMVVLGFVIDVKLDYSYAVVVAIILGSFANGAFMPSYFECEIKGLLLNNKYINICLLANRKRLLSDCTRINT